MPTLGIDIGGSSIKAAVLDDAGGVLWEHRGPTYVRAARATILNALQATVHKAPLEGVERAGLCVPGLLNAGGTAVQKSVNVPGLEGLSLLDIVGAVLPGLRSDAVLATSDAHGAAFDVWANERLPPNERLLCLSLGTGVGACVLDDGVPLRVSGNSPGHIGQVDVSLSGDLEVPRGPDGGHGSLEAYIGLPALHRSRGADPEQAVASLGADDMPCRALVRALRICHAIYRPMHVRLLGGVGIRLASLVPALRERVADGLTSVARENWTLGAGATDFHAARGVARLARRSA